MNNEYIQVYEVSEINIHTITIFDGDYGFYRTLKSFCHNELIRKDRLRKNRKKRRIMGK